MTAFKDKFFKNYAQKDIFTLRKAEYTFLFLGLIAIHAVLANIIHAFFTELPRIEIFINSLSYAVFVIIFLLIYRGRLTFALNIFILLGALRCIQLFFKMYSYEFYIFTCVMSLVTGFVHVRKYQLYFVYAVLTSLTLFRVFFQYRLLGSGQAEIQDFYISIYALMLVYIFMIMIHKFVKIVGMEIEKTKELEKLANTDPLTGVYNRRKFDTCVSSSDMWLKPVSIILLDLDHFKRINDTYGHNIGDDVLKAVVSILKDSLRQDDLIARWGGEEFIIILQGPDLDGTKTVAEKIRKNIQNYNFSPVNQSVTASLGLSLHMGNESIEKTIARADAALYRAKEKGRNRSEVEA